mmetsp:Transcript_27908/g.60592  ORF Transcript_27908/g.60592 Transcript_27908/m.60592 type:complete len:94 (+) Transcript_27908:211-492(+)
MLSLPAIMGTGAGSLRRLAMRRMSIASARREGLADLTRPPRAEALRRPEFPPAGEFVAEDVERSGMGRDKGLHLPFGVVTRQKRAAAMQLKAI